MLDLISTLRQKLFHGQSSENIWIFDMRFSTFLPQGKSGSWVFFLPYLLSLYWNRTPSVASVHSLVQTVMFVLCSPQGSNIWRIPSVLRNGQVRNQFLGHHLKRLKCFMHSLCIVVELVCILVAESMYCWIGVLMGKKVCLGLPILPSYWF